MKIDCLHGYFKFTESRPGDLAHFQNTFGVSIEQSKNRDHYTFSGLAEAPDYAIAGGLYLGCPAIKTFAGAPWEIMRENRLVYNFAAGLVMPIDLILRPVKIEQSGNYLVSSGLILPGSITTTGQRVTDYAAHYIREASVYRYSGISYE